MLTRRRLTALAATSALAPGLLSRTVRAQGGSAWPNRPVHLIVPIAAGGPTDTNARIVAHQLSKIWGQDVVVDNKGGAGTNIGNEFVAHSEPDGYAILYGTSSLASNGALYRALTYSPTKDLAPISLVAKFPFFMFVPNSSPAKTVKDFVDYAKSHPGKLVIGSPGTGSGPHLAELLFMRMAHIQLTHAPYRGAAPAFIDLIPGRIDCYFGSGELLTYSRSGQVRVLGSSGAKRSVAAPNVPTIAEAGVPGYEVESWQAIFAPAKTPPAIVQKMNTGVVKALADPAMVNKLGQTAYTVESSSPEALEKFLLADTAKWSGIIKSAGLRID
ncbi:MAG: tripartite tricarboxylate transporter substrate binding protein [Xanthobacteraceae bacterium]